MNPPDPKSPYGRRDPATSPPYYYEGYRSTIKRGSRAPRLPLPRTISEQTGPGPAISAIARADADLTTNAGTGAEAIGERTIITGQVFDAHGTPVPHTLIEIWQANACGRYIHEADQHPAPLDPNFLGVGRCMTDERGLYRFLTIKPGAYPWRNHANAWRPAHIHFSLFGPAFVSRLVTQMYFPGDPLHELDPILNSISDAEARARLVCRYAHDVTESEWALGYRFDLVLAGPDATPFEPAGGSRDLAKGGT